MTVEGNLTNNPDYVIIYQEVTMRKSPKPFSAEHRAKLSEGLKKAYATGKRSSFRTEETIIKQRESLLKYYESIGAKGHNVRSGEWQKRNPEKYKAQYTVKNAIRDGLLQKSPFCEECGLVKSNIQGHHADYSKPLEVNWLCKSCHDKEHQYGEEEIKDCG